jgi:hypothetical protein
MRKFIEQYYKSNPSDLPISAIEKMADFVGRFMETDEFFLIKTIIDLNYRNKMQECARTGTKTPEADLFMMTGRQSIIDQLEGVCVLNVIRQRNKKALNKAKKEEKKAEKDLSGYGDALGAESEESLIS